MTKRQLNIRALDIEMIEGFKNGHSTFTNNNLRETHGKHDLNNLYFIIFKQIYLSWNWNIKKK